MPRNYKELSLKIGMLPHGWSGGPQELLSALETLGKVLLGDNSTFGSGHTLPHSNIGPFFLEGQVLYVWDDGAGKYVPLKFADNSIPMSALAGGGFSPGDLKPTASGLPQEGWLVCDHSEYGIDDYPNLYAAIGNAYGGTPGSTFRVPDSRGLSLIGDGVGGRDVNDNPLPAYEIGQLVGEVTHQLTIPELPIHDHSLSDDGKCFVAPSGGHGTGNRWLGSGDRAERLICETNKTGGDQGHNNVGPSFVGRYLIKT